MVYLHSDKELNKNKKGIQKMQLLNNKLTLYVPTEDNDGKAIDIEYIESNLINTAGGCTVFDAHGDWLSDGKIYSDQIKAMQVNYTDSDMQAVKMVMNKMILYLLKEGGQEAVSVESYNGLMIYNQQDAKALKQEIKQANVRTL